jgi:hypothetical protein
MTPRASATAFASPHRSLDPRCDEIPRPRAQGTARDSITPSLTNGSKLSAIQTLRAQQDEAAHSPDLAPIPATLLADAVAGYACCLPSG